MSMLCAVRGILLHASDYFFIFCICYILITIYQQVRCVSNDLWRYWVTSVEGESFIVKILSVVGVVSVHRRHVRTAVFAVLHNEGGGRGSSGSGWVWSSGRGDKAATWGHQQHSRTSSLIISFTSCDRRCVVANALDIFSTLIDSLS